MATFVPAPPPGQRTTGVQGPAQTQASSGLAPWLRQSDTALSPLTGGPQLGTGPKLGEGQAAVLEQQRALADQLRAYKPPAAGGAPAAPASAAGGAPAASGAPANMISGLGTPEQNLASLKNIYGARETSGPAKYAQGETPIGQHNWQSLLNDYNPLVPTENKFSNWYAQNEGAPKEGERIFDRKWIKDFDSVSKLPEYTAMYGEPPANASDQEKLDWMGLVNSGGSIEAARQGTVAQNKRTDMTEAGIMMAASAGMGALAAPAGASFLASSMSPASLAGTAAQGAYGMGGDGGGSGGLANQQAMASELRAAPDGGALDQAWQQHLQTGGVTPEIYNQLSPEQRTQLQQRAMRGY